MHLSNVTLIFAVLVIIMWHLFIPEKNKQQKIYTDSIYVVTSGSLKEVFHRDSLGNMTEYHIDNFVDTSGFVFCVDYYTIDNPLKQTRKRFLTDWNPLWKHPLKDSMMKDIVFNGRDTSIIVLIVGQFPDYSLEEIDFKEEVKNLLKKVN